MSTHNICFHEEIRKILCGYPFLSGAMALSQLRHVSTGKQFGQRTSLLTIKLIIIALLTVDVIIIF